MALLLYCYGDLLALRLKEQEHRRKAILHGFLSKLLPIAAIADLSIDNWGADHKRRCPEETPRDESHLRWVGAPSLCAGVYILV